MCYENGVILNIIHGLYFFFLWSVPVEAGEEEKSSDEEDSVVLETVEVTLGTLDLREYEVQPNKKKRKKRKEKREGDLMASCFKN